MEQGHESSRRALFRDLATRAGQHVAEHVIDKLGSLGINAGQQSAELPWQHIGSRSSPRLAPFRPPGATEEAEFVAMCVRCRRCVDACPQHCIVPAQARSGTEPGTPVLIPNEVPCTLCGACMDVCESGALMPTPAAFVRIGLARIETATCLGHQGQECSQCHSACPTLPNAISFGNATSEAAPKAGLAHVPLFPSVDAQHCTGCGLCVAACPTDPRSIRIMHRVFEDGASWDATREGA